MKYFLKNTIDKMMSLQLAHQLRDRHVLLVGAGEVSMTRVVKLIPTGCKITVISPEVHPDMWSYFDGQREHAVIDSTDKNWSSTKGKIYRIIKRKFRDNDLILYGDGRDLEKSREAFLCGKSKEIDWDLVKKRSGSNVWSLILTCIPDPLESEHIYRGAKLLFGEQMMCNVADNPPLCDFYFGSNVILGADEGQKTLPIQIMISSNGNSPRFTALLKGQIEKQFGSIPVGPSVYKLGQLRSSVRKISDQFEKQIGRAQMIKYRMEWIRTCTDIFGVTNCHAIETDKLSELFQKMAAEKSLEFPTKEIMLKEYMSNES